MPQSLNHHEAAPWPYRELDIAALRADGWQPLPFQEFVLKIHQLCNLACDYCYVYTMADQSWRTRPKTMSRQVWSAAAERIGAHAARHQLDEITVVLHGGEPLLAGSGVIEEIVVAVQAAVPANTTCHIAIQTNGVLLDAAALRMLDRHDIQIGVSIDGTAEDHDRHRFHANRRGSFDDVQRALTLLGDDRYRRLFSGLLATIDPASDPVLCYESLLKFEPPSIGFLLPHANWSAPHPAASSSLHPFGDWLVKLFDRWYDVPVQETGIRLFEEMIHAALGGQSNSEEIGLSPAVVAVVETDGDIEQVDSLKSAYAAAPATGLSVLHNSFDDAVWHPGIVARQLGVEALSETCRGCEFREVCGGGMYPHRYREGQGFRNPSVYCADLAHIIQHVQHRVLWDLKVRGSDCG